MPMMNADILSSMAWVALPSARDSFRIVPI
jgi:hypothetical protein